MAPSLAPLGFASHVLDNPSGPPFLVAERMEDDAAVTVLIYGTAIPCAASTICGGAAFRPGS